MCDGGHHHSLLIRRGGSTSASCSARRTPATATEDWSVDERRAVACWARRRRARHNDQKGLKFTMGMPAIPQEPPSTVYAAPCSQPSRTSLRQPLKTRPSLAPAARDAPPARATVAPGGWLSECPSSDTAQRRTPAIHFATNSRKNRSISPLLVSWRSGQVARAAILAHGGAQKRRPSVTDARGSPKPNDAARLCATRARPNGTGNAGRGDSAIG